MPTCCCERGSAPTLDGIVDAIDAAVMTRKAGEAAMVNAVERIAVSQIKAP